MQRTRVSSHRRVGSSSTVLGPVVILVVLVVAYFVAVLGTANAQPRRVGEQEVTVDKAIKAAIIDSVLTDINRTYVFPEKAKEMDKFVRRQLRKKKYENFNTMREFTEKLTEDLNSIAHDGHLWVAPMPPGWVTEEDTLTEEERNQQRLAEMKFENYGFEKIERLPGNIGYLKFNYFADANHAGGTAIAAMNFLGNVDALIIDLRNNGGGDPSMVQLISSYFFDEAQHLNSFYIRKTDQTRQFWTPDYVQGQRLVNQPIYVLTSGQTFSGAEEFTYNLKNMERATIIGDTTGGGAHPTDQFVYPTLGVLASIPFGRAVNPITGTNWEGTGVAPHIAVPAPEALDVAKMEAYKKLLENPRDEDHRFSLEWALSGLEAQRNPVELPLAELQAYVGTYGPRRIWLEEGVLKYQRGTNPVYRLQPMGQDKFLLPDLARFRTQFVRDDAGNVVKLVGLYENGFTDEHERSRE